MYGKCDLVGSIRYKDEMNAKCSFFLRLVVFFIRHIEIVLKFAV